ncbi:MAG: hypothetical protein KBT29_02195 [Prevotellaceae bacterium]|nr:hypothetical protein [Candidatus Minthosoma caballi]
MRKTVRAIRKLRHGLPLLFIICSSLSTLSSCGLVDFELGDEEKYTHIFFDPDSLTVMVGDSINLTPMVGSMTTLPSAVYWETTDSSVAVVNNNIFMALSEGEARLKATSTIDRISAECGVYVIPRWEVNSNEYSDEMVVYASTEMLGTKFNPDSLIVAAFCAGECRGIAEKKEWNDKEYLQIRVYGELDYKDEDEDELYPDIITFRYYDRQLYRWNYFNETMLFDGETHGTLSNLMMLTKKK